jgi:hypothetical protein
MSDRRDLYEAMMACVPSGSLMPAWAAPLIEAGEALQVALERPSAILEGAPEMPAAEPHPGTEEVARRLAKKLVPPGGILRVEPEQWRAFCAELATVLDEEVEEVEEAFKPTQPRVLALIHRGRREGRQETNAALNAKAQDIRPPVGSLDLDARAAGACPEAVVQAYRSANPAAMSQVTARMREILLEDDRAWTGTQPTPAPAAKEELKFPPIEPQTIVDVQAGIAKASARLNAAMLIVDPEGLRFAAAPRATRLCRRYTDKCPADGPCAEGGCPVIYPRNSPADDDELAHEVANGGIRLLDEDDGSPA